MENKKTPQQIQFEQVKDKLQSSVADIQKILNLMPIKGNTSTQCQRQYLLNLLGEFENGISGITLSDFTPNEYSSNFKLSYS